MINPALLFRWPFLWAAITPGFALFIAHSLVVAGLVPIPVAVGVQGFFYSGVFWYCASFPTFWVISRVTRRGIYLIVACTVPAMLVEIFLFTFGQLAPSEEEYQRNTQSLHFWLAVYLALGFLTTAVYITLIKRRPSSSAGAIA